MVVVMEIIHVVSVQNLLPEESVAQEEQEQSAFQVEQQMLEQHLPMLEQMEQGGTVVAVEQAVKEEDFPEEIMQ